MALCPCEAPAEPTGWKVTIEPQLHEDLQPIAVSDPVKRAEFKERLHLCMDWLQAIELFWPWGSKSNKVVAWARESLEFARIIQAISEFEANDDIVSIPLDELEMCVTRSLLEAQEYGEIWRDPNI